MDERDLQAIWQDQAKEPVPSELALSLTMPRSSLPLDYAAPTSLFRAAPPKPKRSPMVFAFAAMAAGVVLTAGFLNFRVHGVPAPHEGAGPREVSVEDRLDMLLQECRSWSNPEAGVPDWKRARAACQQALDLEPINAEANELSKRISVLGQCEAQLQTSLEHSAAGRTETALEQLSKMDGSCGLYLLRAMPLARSLSVEVIKQAGADCREYAENGKWVVALERCELYARYACQTMTPGELYPPVAMRLKARGKLNPKTDWRPADERYLTFLEAREKVNPDERMWLCPELPAVRAPPAPPDQRALALSELIRRGPLPEIGQALSSYFRGEFQSAPLPLQKVLESMSKAEHHAATRALLLDLNNAINLYENGTTEANQDRPDKAAASFYKALAIDERLVLGAQVDRLSPDQKKGQLKLRQSYLRRSVAETMAVKSYEKGRALADRKDFRAACRVWKLGSDFGRTNIDLLKALTNVCTRRASEATSKAETCEQFRAAQDFAVDGDGFKEQIELQLSILNCH